MGPEKIQTNIRDVGSGAINRITLKTIVDLYLQRGLSILEAVNELSTVYPMGYMLAAELAIVEAQRQQNPKILALTKKYCQDLSTSVNPSPYLRLEAEYRLAELDLRQKILIDQEPPTEADIYQF